MVKSLYPKNTNRLFDEIAFRTPSYASWQQQIWLIHCDEPCKFIGYADYKMLAPYFDEIIEDIKNEGYSSDFALRYISKDGDAVGCLFQCVKCGKHRLHVDAS